MSLVHDGVTMRAVSVLIFPATRTEIHPIGGVSVLDFSGLTGDPNCGKMGVQNFTAEISHGGDFVINTAEDLIQRLWQSQPVALYLDHLSFYSTLCRHPGRPSADYLRLRDWLVGGRFLARCRFYHTLAREDGAEGGADKQESLLRYLTTNQFEIHRTGGNQAPPLIARQLLSLASGTTRINTIVLIGGDACFIEPIRFLRSLGVRTELAFFQQETPSPLMRVADRFIDLTHGLSHYQLSRDAHP